MRTQSVQTIQCVVRRCRPRCRVLIARRCAGASGPEHSEHTPYWRALRDEWPTTGRIAPGSAPAVYKIKPLFRTRARRAQLWAHAARPSTRAGGSFVRQGRDRLRRRDQTRRRSKEPPRDRHPSLLLCKHYEARVTQARGPRELRGRLALPAPPLSYPPPVNGIGAQQNDRPPALLFYRLTVLMAFRRNLAPNFTHFTNI